MEAYHGLKFVVMARLIVGLRAAAFLTAGLVRVPFPRFILVDLTAVLLSVPVSFGWRTWWPRRGCGRCSSGSAPSSC
jgi:membrane protein DedA with SNARE-associated domain